MGRRNSELQRSQWFNYNSEEEFNRNPDQHHRKLDGKDINNTNFNNDNNKLHRLLEMDPKLFFIRSNWKYFDQKQLMIQLIRSF